MANHVFIQGGGRGRVGPSDWPDPKQFAYTFDHCAEITTLFTEALAISRYTLYMQDYGGPTRRARDEAIIRYAA